jgi:hypothetical protein
MFRQVNKRDEPENERPSKSMKVEEATVCSEGSHEFLEEIKTRIDRLMEMVNRNDRFLHTYE